MAMDPVTESARKGKRDTSVKRLSILQAAMRAFSDEGYDKVSMDHIADIANASKRTVYNHFSSKEILFQEVIGQFAKEMQSLKEIRYETSRSLENQLADFADAELALINNPTWLGFMKVLLTVFIRDPELARQTMSRYQTEEDPLVAWMRAASQDNRLSVDTPELAAGVFRSMMGGAFTWPAVYQGYLDANYANILKKELIDMFLCRYRKNAE